MGLSGRDCGGTTDHSQGLVNQTSTPGNGKRKPAGSTPTMVYGIALMVAALPTMEESPPNRRHHRSALIIATAGPPRESSSGRKPRPSSGVTPRMLRKLAETRAPFSASGSAPPEAGTF